MYILKKFNIEQLETNKISYNKGIIYLLNMLYGPRHKGPCNVYMWNAYVHLLLWKGFTMVSGGKSIVNWKIFAIKITNVICFKNYVCIHFTGKSLEAYFEECQVVMSG